MNKTNWQIKKSGKVENLFQPIINKYEKLKLQNSPIYVDLKNKLQDQIWVDKVADILNKVKNAADMFKISDEITEKKNDQRIEEMFAEFDVAARLSNTKFFGDFPEVEYLPKSKDTHSPDFLTKNGNNLTPVEVKLLSPQGLDEKKFFQKLIDKINNQALKQLQCFYQKQQFDTGTIFIWSHRPIQLQNISYQNLKVYFSKKITKQNFNVAVICILSNLGLWNFYL